MTNSRTLRSILDPESLDPGLRTLVAAIENRPDLPERLARMAIAFRGKGQGRDARALAEAARRLSPDDLQIQALTDWSIRKQAPLWHFPLVHDEIRNQAYADALHHFVKPGMTVFEIGTGTGLLAMLAARAGAAHVYTCETQPAVAEAAREIIARNGLGERITVIAKNATELRIGSDMPERADLFVAEIVDNSLLGEGVLPLTEYARAELLKPDAILLPRAISAIGMLVSGDDYRQNYRMDDVMGFDLTPFNRFAPSVVATGPGGGRPDPLSQARELLTLDLTIHQPAMKAPQTRMLTADREGVADGILRWHRLDFGAGIQFENCPPSLSAWHPQLHLFRTPRQVKSADKVSLSIFHDRERLYIEPTVETE
jgi:type II protein arginine methyltransferase